MTNTEYNKLLKYLYFEGYANSYEEADYILEDMSNIERKQLMMEATRMRKYFNKKYGNKNEYGENEAAAKEAITRRKISRNKTPYPHPPIRGSSQHLQFARQKAKSQNEAYELLLDYLIDEGYTNTVDGAVTIIENMSDDWMESILEAYKRLPVGKMMRKVEYRAEREAETRAEREREADNPNSILGYDRAKKAHVRAERDKERSNEMIRVADTHSKKEAKSKSKYKK